MDSFPKETNRYAFAMVKAARTMPEDIAVVVAVFARKKFNLVQS